MPTLSSIMVPERSVTESAVDTEARLIVENLRAGFGRHEVLKGINARIPPRSVTAIMGPSGCGKSTFIRCINRLHEENAGAWVTGNMILDGENLYSGSLDPVELRRKIGMVFQRPNPFPTMSIYANVAVGPKLNGMKRSLIE